MEPYLIAANVSLVLVVAFVIARILKLRKITKNYEVRFAPVLDIEKEVASIAKQKNDLETSIQELRASYKEKKAIFDQLVRDAAVYDEEIELAELGFYKPHFDFDTSDKYKEEIATVRDAQKQMIFNKTAIFCETEWTVEGSRAKGRTMTNRGIRLTARAFNNECAAAISSITWNNAQRMEQRIQKAFEAINKLNESSAIKISPAYLDLKLKELQLSHEYREKKQEEKEEQAEARRQMREEAKLQQEVEKAVSEEMKYEKLLEKSKREAAEATDEQLHTLQETISAITKELEIAHAKSERALSMAQQTKSGHVYIVSNIGSFGNGVYKIGMTRRLDPIDRVKELGDASVPFSFDTHALIYAKDAPALEKALQKAFESRRINLVNNRKEFFRVGLHEIRDEVKKLFPDAEFVKVGEAREYRETMAIHQQRENAQAKSTSVAQYPDEI